MKRSNLAISVPRFTGLKPASAKASRIAAATSNKRGTACERKLQRSVRKLGLRFRTHVSALPGCPDLVFNRARMAVFVDGDFWHGRNLAHQIAKLSTGHNGGYWVRKIRSNVARDRRVRRELRALGWRVVRLWETDIHAEPDRAAARVARAVAESSRL